MRGGAWRRLGPIGRPLTALLLFAGAGIIATGCAGAGPLSAFDRNQLACGGVYTALDEAHQGKLTRSYLLAVAKVSEEAADHWLSKFGHVVQVGVKSDAGPPTFQALLYMAHRCGQIGLPS